MVADWLCGGESGGLYPFNMDGLLYTIDDRLLGGWMNGWIEG